MKLLLFLLGLLLPLVAQAAPAVQIPNCPLGYACVDANMTVAQIQAVINANGGQSAKPIYFLPGDYSICSQLTVTTSMTTITGPTPVNADNGSSGAPTPSPARLSCGAPGTFVVGQAMIHINAQYVTIQNLNFIGLFGIGGAANIACVQTYSGGNFIKHNTFGNCYYGVLINAVNTGCCSTFNQDNHVEDNIFIDTGFDGILCEATTGSGCTDNFFDYNHFDVNSGDFGIRCDIGCGNGTIVGNRFEDGASGIWLKYASASTASFMTISDNYFQSIFPIQFTNADNVIVMGNQFNCFEAVPGLQFFGQSGAIVSKGNTFGACSTSAYQVDASETVFDGPAIFDDLPLSEGYYDSTHTASLLEPWIGVPPSPQWFVITPVSTTFTPVISGNVHAFEIDLTANSTLADFTYHVAGAPIIRFKFKQDATGGRTVTYNAAYLNTPTIGTTASLCSYATAIMNTTTTIFTGASINNVACN